VAVVLIAELVDVNKIKNKDVFERKK